MKSLISHFPQRCFLNFDPIFFLWAFLCAPIFLSGCARSQNPINTVLPPTPFDTSFSIDAINMPDSEVLSHSVISKGNLQRLRYFLLKAQTGYPLKIGCIGGSITAGAMTDTIDARYINRFAALLQRQFSKSKFSIINAGIGATNSRFGCSRVSHDLLIENPDLIIIEYAVNDFLEDSTMNMQTIEGLIRQCLRLDSVPTLMLFTTDSAGNDFNQNDQGIIGNYYALPMISYQNAIWPLITNNRLSWSSVAVDVVHPNDNGHMIIAYLLYSFIRTVFLQMDTLSPPPFPMPSPLTTDLYEFAGIHSSAAGDPLVVSANSGWASEETKYLRLAYASSNQGDSLVFKTSLNEVTVGYQYTKSLSGIIEVKLDGRIIDTIDSHFTVDPGYLRLYRVYAQTNNAPHTITLSNINNALFYIEYMLYAR
jgi:hypothetical protein